MPMTWEKLLNASRRRQTTLPRDLRQQFERDYTHHLLDAGEATPGQGPGFPPRAPRCRSNQAHPLT